MQLRYEEASSTDIKHPAVGKPKENRVGNKEKRKSKGKSTPIARPVDAKLALKWCHRRTQDIEDLLKNSGDVERLRDELKDCVQQYLQLLPGRGRPPPPNEQIKTAPLIRRLYANTAKCAVYHGREGCLEWALDHGARPNTLTHNRNTLLHLAAHTGNPSICYMLLQRGTATV